MKRLTRVLARLPVLGPLLGRGYAAYLRRRFRGSEAYWEERYARGRDSGAGSNDELAAFKAEFLNAFVARQGIASVIEHGCGDGSQLARASYPEYLGLDVSPQALELCRRRFDGDASKRFGRVGDHDGARAELALSLDVIYHLVEDAVFEAYMGRVFASAQRFVIVYSSNRDEQDDPQPPHVRHRRFESWIETHAPAWRRVERVPNRHPWQGVGQGGSFADFYVYARD